MRAATAMRAMLGAMALAFLLLPGLAQATTIERVISPGGIEAWLVREVSIPLIAMEFTFRGGANQDPADKPGVGYMTGGLLDEGAGDLDAKAFSARVEDLAGQISFTNGRDYFRGSLRTLTDNREQTFDLLRLALTAPRFDTDAIERVRSEIMAKLQREAVNPGNIASRRWWETAFAGHPYARPTDGTVEAVARIGVDDLRTYVKQVLARDTLKIAVVGDIDAATLGPLLDRVFGSLPAKADLAAISAVTAHGLGQHLTLPLDVPQTVITFGGIGIARSDPDFMAAYIVNHILGGGSFSSRLYREVREERGLVYSVASALIWYQYTSVFTGATATRSERADETMALIEQQIRRIAEDGPTEEELAKAKTYLKGAYALGFDTSSKIASQLLQIQIDGVGMDYIERRGALIDAVTLDDARRVAKRLLGGGMLFTAVGRAAPQKAGGG